ncbi:hypothetical protein R5R35_003772 [Gryllus longicercus]|uniref:Protein kinase domain-containing protein n=1 Tax=Gryllus longicercus TaxID=2509291 RepID=A0AAN9V3S7_9ORTH
MLTFEPDPSHYQSCGALATCCEGAGSVHLARHLPSGNLVALKKFNMERAGDDAALVQHEVRLTRQLRHPHVLGLHAAFVAGPHVVAVLPLMAFGSCRDLLNAHFANGLPEAAVACVLSDALLGLEYIHRRGIVHRAVRASHILVSGSGRACLSGLRYSCPLVENGRWQKALHSFPQSTARNLNWLSPEVLEQNLQGYNEKSDVYSLGVTACELANGAIPFADMPTTLMLTEKVRGCCPQLLDCSTVAECDDDGPGTNEGNGGSGSDAGLLHHGADTLNIREGAGSGRIECAEVVTEYAQRRFSDAFHQMTELCLQRDPVQRPAASQLLQHPFFKNARRTGSGTCSLPELLHPVMPLGDRHVATQDDLASMLAAERLSELDMEPDQWDF